jgi:hypothetical protein
MLGQTSTTEAKKGDYSEALKNQPAILMRPPPLTVTGQLSQSLQRKSQMIVDE